MVALNLLLALLMLHEPQGSADVCNCEAAPAHDGWCQPHSVGHFAGLSFTSKQLGEVLDFHGHSVSIDKTKCATCRSMIQSGGYCEECHMGFVDGKGYFSRLCYQIAKGKPLDPSAPAKPCCKKAANANTPNPNTNGWCGSCKQGVVGNKIYSNKADFDRTAAAIRVFEAAIAKSADCETCAVAMIADARCPTCRITFQDGKPIAKNSPKTVPPTDQ